MEVEDRISGEGVGWEWSWEILLVTALRKTVHKSLCLQFPNLVLENSQTTHVFIPSKVSARLATFFLPTGSCERTNTWTVCESLKT